MDTTAIFTKAVTEQESGQQQKPSSATPKTQKDILRSACQNKINKHAKRKNNGK